MDATDRTAMDDASYDPSESRSDSDDDVVVQSGPQSCTRVVAAGSASTSNRGKQKKTKSAAPKAAAPKSAASGSTFFGKRDAFSILGKAKVKAPKLSGAAGPGGKPPTGDGAPATGRGNAWYHQHFKPVAAEHQGKSVAQLREANVLMKCSFCDTQKTFNPCTRLKNHLLTGCSQFQESAHYSSEMVLKELHKIKRKVLLPLREVAQYNRMQFHGAMHTLLVCDQQESTVQQHSHPSLSVQQDSSKLQLGERASKTSVDTANQLLMKALIEKKHPFQLCHFSLLQGLCCTHLFTPAPGSFAVQACPDT